MRRTNRRLAGGARLAATSLGCMAALACAPPPHAPTLEPTQPVEAGADPPASGSAEETSDDDALTPAQAREDLEALCDEIDKRYIYLKDKVGNWDQCREVFGAMAESSATHDAFIHVAERAVAELYDDHAGLRAHADGSPLVVPTLADVWVEMHDGKPMITAVKLGSPAAEAGVRAGSVLVSVGGESVGRVLASSAPKLEVLNPDASAAYRLRAALAGRRGVDRRTFEVSDPDGRPAQFDLPTLAGRSSDAPMVEQRRVDERFGYIRINNALGDQKLIAAFDRALDALLETDGLLLDLRNTPSGGGSAIAEPILARLVDAEVPYQRMRWLAGRGDSAYEHLAVAHIVPRGDAPPYRKPIFVLVSRWTGSMGEGIAVGLHGAGRATVVGTEMARLGGSVVGFEMPNSKLGFQFPIRQIDVMDGTPRQTFVPPVYVDLSAAAARPKASADPIFDVALQALRKRTQKKKR